MTSLNVNDMIGFKCMHYSVTESNGTVDIAITKKDNSREFTFGVRTVDDVEGSAQVGKDYVFFDELIKMGPSEVEYRVQIPIIDNNEWEPDLDFFVELYDARTEKKVRLSGDDTRCKVTILDEDFPGIIGFVDTQISVTKKHD